MVVHISGSAPLEHRLTYVLGKNRKENFRPEHEGFKSHLKEFVRAFVGHGKAKYF